MSNSYPNSDPESRAVASIKVLMALDVKSKMTLKT
jgi:hypothetical protein